MCNKSSLHLLSFPEPFAIGNAFCLGSLAPSGNIPQTITGVAVHPASRRIVVAGGGHLYEYAPASSPAAPQEEP